MSRWPHPVLRAPDPVARHPEESFRTIGAAESETEVAYIFNQYHLISCPVVDADGRLVGVITIDDAMNVLDEEHEEDMLRLAGVNDDSNVSDGSFATARGGACPGWSSTSSPPRSRPS